MAAPDRITVKDLHKVIESGGAVLHRGEIITHKDNLPSEADLKAAHEGKERIRYNKSGPETTSAHTSIAPGDPLHLDEDGNQIPAATLPAGTDAAAQANAAGESPSNPEAASGAKPKAA